MKACSEKKERHHFGAGGRDSNLMSAFLYSLSPLLPFPLIVLAY